MSIFFEEFFYTKKQQAKTYCFFYWRCGWDSNPRYREVQLISSQSRYDHFDTTPYMLNSRRSVTNYSIFLLTGRVPLCPVAVSRKNLRIRWRSILFDRGHSFLLASSATGSTRKRPHFDISPQKLTYELSLDNLDSHTIIITNSRSVK